MTAVEKPKNINLTGKWVGNTLGTHPCNVFAEFFDKDGKHFLEIKAATQFGEVSTFYGEVANSNVQPDQSITVSITEVMSGQSTGVTGYVDLNPINDNLLEGGWEATTGAKGVIQLSKRQPFKRDDTLKKEPTEIIAKEYKFGTLTIYKDDIEEIIKILEQMVSPNGYVFITYEHDGSKKTCFADTYLNKQDKPTEYQSLSIGAQKNIDGFTHSIVVNLKRSEESNIFVQSPDILWYYSTPMAVKELLEKRSSRVIDFYRKHGLTLNGIVFLILLAWLPSYDFFTRSVFVSSFLVFALLHVQIHKRASLSIISPIKNIPTSFKEKHPTVSYLFNTFISALIAAVIGLLLSKWDTIFGFIESLLSGV